MLLQFKFKNFKSFKEETVLDMTAACSGEYDGDLLEPGGTTVLPVAAIFGANAGGKSNIFHALGTMSACITKERDIALSPFLFDSVVKNEPTEFEVSINIDGREYRYGFSGIRKSVSEEWLFDGGICVFHRSAKGCRIDVEDGKERTEIEFIHSMTDETELILTSLGRRRKSGYSKVFNWFSGNIRFYDFSNDSEEIFIKTDLLSFLYNNKDSLREIVRLIQKFDSAIADVSIEKERDFNGSGSKYILYSHHLDEIENVNKIRFENESSGIRKLFSIALLLLSSLNEGNVLFVDELDSRLHPLVLRYIVKMYGDRDSNSGGGQLIFSSHNLICLDSADLRRDEIWFVEKNNQVSTLYSLFDFVDEESSDAEFNFSKNYLTGRFGAIPFQDTRGE